MMERIQTIDVMILNMTGLQTTPNINEAKTHDGGYTKIEDTQIEKKPEKLRNEFWKQREVERLKLYSIS